MDQAVRHTLDHNQTIDITTTGRRTGQPRRIEIFIHNIDGRLVISGMPRPGSTRAWLHNLVADPRLTLHLRGSFGEADVAATARVITDADERRELLTAVARNWNRSDLDVMVEHSPLVVVSVQGYGGTSATI